MTTARDELAVTQENGNGNDEKKSNRYNFSGFENYLLHRLDSLEYGLRQEIYNNRDRIDNNRDRIDSNRDKIDNNRDKIDNNRDKLDKVLMWAIGIFFTMIVGFAAVLVPLLQTLSTITK